MQTATPSGAGHPRPDTSLMRHRYILGLGYCIETFQMHRGEGDGYNETPQAEPASCLTSQPAAAATVLTMSVRLAKENRTAPISPHSTATNKNHKYGTVWPVIQHNTCIQAIPVPLGILRETKARLRWTFCYSNSSKLRSDDQQQKFSG